jgi:hypothetical protein
MVEYESRRNVGQALLLAFMAILCICQSGCFRWTTAAWRIEGVGERNHVVSGVRVSPEGDLCVIYESCLARARFDWSRTFSIWEYPLARDPYHASRAVILTAEDVQRMTARNEGHVGGIPFHAIPKDCILPSKAWKLTLDQDRLDRETAGWREVPLILFRRRNPEAGQNLRAHIAAEDARKKKMEAEARAIGAALQSTVFDCDQRLSGRKDACPFMGPSVHLELPDGKDGRMLIRLPRRSGVNPWGRPIRILLTPPALAADIAEGLVKAPMIVYGIYTLDFGH